MLTEGQCDEIHPVCGNCLKHNISCDFTPSRKPGNLLPLQPVKIPPLHRNSLLKTPSPGSSRNSPSRSSTRTRSPSNSLGSNGKNYSSQSSDSVGHPIPVSMSTPIDRLLELRLFNHYLEKTSQGFVRQMKGQGVWTNWITSLALTSPCLMDVVLGFSAFHLRYLAPSDKAVREASHRYMARGITEHAKQLREGINAENAEVVFATSTFIAFHAASGQRFLDGNDLPLHWFRPWQGIRAVLAVGWKYIQNVEIKELVQYERIEQSQLLAIAEKRLQLPQQAFYFLVSDLDRDGLDQETVDAYENAVACLSGIFDNPLTREVFRFTALVSNRFVDLLAARDPRALAIVGYFFMQLRRLDRVWWLQGAVDREFKMLMQLLPEEWKPMMDWAVREFEGGESEESNENHMLSEDGDSGF